MADNVTILDKLVMSMAPSLKNRVVAIILCGSAGSRVKIPNHSDIDIILVAKEIEYDFLVSLAEYQAKLDMFSAEQLSLTVITEQEAQTIQDVYKNVDGKAVQAIIDLVPENIKILKEDFAIPQLTPEEIRAFSIGNHSVLHALLRKHIVRTHHTIPSSEKLKIIKIAMIVVKMILQGERAFDDNQARKCMQDLLKAKTNFEDLDSAQIRKLALRVLNLKASCK